MHYCGVDLSMKSTHMCVETEQGRRGKQGAVAARPAALEAVLSRM